jgi:hypothetical protein
MFHLTYPYFIWTVGFLTEQCGDIEKIPLRISLGKPGTVGPCEGENKPQLLMAES